MSFLTELVRPVNVKGLFGMNIFGQFNEQLVRYRKERRAINELRSLSDRELMDMGVSRAMIPVAVRKGLQDR